MVCRRSHGLIVKIKGSTKYCFENRTLNLSADHILFVEKGSSYTKEEKEPGFSYVVNFDAPRQVIDAFKANPVLDVPDMAMTAERLHRFWQKNNVYGALACLYTLFDKSCAKTESYLSARDRKILAPVENYLAEHLTDPALTIDALSELCSVSQVYLRRIFKRKYGLSPSSYVVRERIRSACLLLTDGSDRPISQIAPAVGYTDPLYFSRIFKKQTGMSPSEFRREHSDDLF